MSIAGTVISSLIVSNAQQIAKRLRNALGSAAAPDQPLLQRAVERLFTTGIFEADKLGSQMTPDIIEYLLQYVLSTPENPMPQLTKDVVATLFAKCQITPYGNQAFPQNRAHLPPPNLPVQFGGSGGVRNLDFNYHVDVQSFPTIPGLTRDELPDLIKAAWILWMESVGELDLKVASSAEKANLIIKCLPMDGRGNKLAEATLGGGPGAAIRKYDLLIDTLDDWSDVKLLATVTHELGHCLGIDHLSDSGALMYPALNRTFLTGGVLGVRPTPSDVDAAQSLWGKPA